MRPSSRTFTYTLAGLPVVVASTMRGVLAPTDHLVDLLARSAAERSSLSAPPGQLSA